MLCRICNTRMGIVASKVLSEGEKVLLLQTFACRDPRCSEYRKPVEKTRELETKSDK